MNDKELLILAAKAAGINLDYRAGGDVFYYDDELSGREEFNPLDDDGQAFRLAVDLGIDVHTKWGDDDAVTYIGGGLSFAEAYCGNKYAATRRAAVRAAAAIGGAL